MPIQSVQIQTTRLFMTPPKNNIFRIVLLTGDLLAILLFVFIGQQDHDTMDVNNPVLGLLKSAAPFLITWLVVAFIVHAYPKADVFTIRSLLTSGLNAWLIAAPFGLILRAFLLGRATIPIIFMLLTLLVAGAFILIWRLLFAWGWQARQKQANSSPQTS